MTGRQTTMPGQWRNWGRNQSARPQAVAEPRDEAAVAETVARAAAAGLTVKPVGAGHSFSSAATTEGVALRLTQLSGITAVSPDRGEVTVRAGTPLRTFNAELHLLGLALPNLGDVDQQALAGALSTGTHGTGLSRTGLSAGVRALRVVLADGSVRACSPTHDSDLFRAMQVGLGAVGVATEYTVAVVPRYLLRAQEGPEPVDGVLEAFASLNAENDHFEFYWFPHTDRAMTKRNNVVPQGSSPRPLPSWKARLDDDLLSNRLFEKVNAGLLRAPRLTPRVNQLSARALSAREYTDWSHRVFVTQRDVRFVESEWAFPVEAFQEVFGELRQWVERSDETIAFPVECRVAAADDLWLSTASGRASCYIAIHKYHRQPQGRYFREFEAIARAHGGRPHWGKMHWAGPEYLRSVYARYEQFVQVRDAVDPGRVFANDYTRQVLPA